MYQCGAVSISTTSNNIPPGSKDINPNSVVTSKLRSNRKYQDAGKTTQEDDSSISDSQERIKSANESQTAKPTPARMTRQRAAHLAYLDEAALQKDEGSPLSISTSNSTSSQSPPVDSVSQICLCQPEPKIPRPRNAFILYRQHHQKNITASEERLSNPDISKIAGERWRSESDNVKEEWRALAAEEKARHAQQYPKYRFQPRHKNRTAAALQTGGKARCLKCGGQSIASSSSPFTPLSTPTTSLKIRFMGNDCQGSLSSNSSRDLGKAFNKQLEISTPLHRLDSRYVVASSPGTRKSSQGTMEMPDRKRIRYEGHPSSVHVPTSAPQSPRHLLSNGQMAHDGRHTYSSPLAMEVRRGSLHMPSERQYHARGSISYSPSSPPLNTPHPSAVMMGPPPPRANVSTRNGLHAYPATPATAHSQYPPRTRPETESLCLPPLLSPGAPDQSRSVEAMVMSIPVLGKITLLRRIAPPIKEANPASPPSRVRGSIITVEGGESSGAAEDMVLQLQAELHRHDEFDVKFLPGPELPGPESTIKDFIEVVAAWHDKTKEMIDFITGVASARDENYSSAASVASSEDIDMEEGEVLEGPRRVSHDVKVARLHELENKKAEVKAARFIPSPRSDKIPILLVSNYILHACDKWASTLPITDVYSPADHWTWTATLWRGIVGADLTVYVRNMDKEVQELPQSAGQEHMHVKGGGSVEMKEDVGAILVKRENGRVEDGAVRRVAFEVGEWVRMQANKSV